MDKVREFMLFMLMPTQERVARLDEVAQRTSVVHS